MDDRHPMIWRRCGRLRVRRLRRADRLAVAALADGSARAAHSLEAGGDRSLEALVGDAPELQLVIELDSALIGAALGRRAGPPPEAPAQPWEPLGAAGEVEADDRRHLRGCGLFWRPELSAAHVERVFDLARKGLVQQFGLESVYAFAPLTGYERREGVMSLPAYLQQVHAGSMRDEPLATFLDAGYLLRGFERVGEEARALVVWRNRAR